MSFLKPRAESRCRPLPQRLRVKDVADACRSAALAFAWCARASWGKRELARWLLGPYARAIEATREPPAARRLPRRSVSSETVHELLARSHAHVLAVLRSSGSWKSDARFARLMVDGGVVVGVIDDESAIGYAPVASAEMRLVDRVTSLFVADFLTRPADYTRFRICDLCEGVTFDSAAEHAESCGGAAMGSGIRPAVTAPAARRVTLIGLGDRAA
ncbi:MAG: hypothetical protein KF764_23460 [Labilithrix sp.]|nr:hypothetical protein [Labilithrix sp.]MBX3222922.1 hypothetical protein [Labilithrix sp.]